MRTSKLKLLFWGILLILNLLSSDLNAIEGNSELSTSELFQTPINHIGSYMYKTGYVLSAPLHWEQASWDNAILITGIASTTILFDHMIKNNLHKDRKSTVMKLTTLPDNILGSSKVMGSGALVSWSLGHMMNDYKLQQTSRLALEGIIFSAAVTTGIKSYFHRARPYASSSSSNWKGPNHKSYPSVMSFPSGHSACAFSVATVISQQYSDVEIVPWISYSLAILTAWSRVYLNKHWASDVIVGSAIGHYTAKMIMELENTNYSNGSYIAPFIGYSIDDLIMGLKIGY